MKAGHVVPIVVSAALPGCGHIAAGRPIKGLLLFFLFGFAVDGYFYAQAQSILPPDPAALSPTAIRCAALAAGAVLWLFAIADTTAIALRRRRSEARADEATAHIRRALVAYLRSDYPAAVQALQLALRIHPSDPDALYHLGLVYSVSGQLRKARRALRRCARHDRDGKWHHDAAHLLQVVRDAAPPTPPAKPQKEPQGETNA